MLTPAGKQAKQRPTISDVARLAGVSISTVSRVVNDTAPVSDEVGERVRNAINMLSYTPHAAARNLAAVDGGPEEAFAFASEETTCHTCNFLRVCPRWIDGGAPDEEPPA